MDNKEKKGYGGCLSVLLPLWIIGQIFSLIINVGFAAFLSEFPLIPILLIGSNIVALIGIILLLQFKKIGFYIFILTYFLTFLLGVLYPDYVDSSISFKSIVGLGLFLLLMCIKNKETKLNGFQTLGIFKSPINIEDSVSQKQVTRDNVITNANNEIITTSDFNKDETTISEEEHPDFRNENKEVEEQDLVVDNNHTNSISEPPHKAKKLVYIIILLFLIISIITLYLLTKDNRSNQEIYNDAKELIEKKDYKEGIKELTKIEDDFIQAKSLLGKLYYYNDTIGINKNLGEKLLWEAFEKNDSDACHTLWDIYREKGDWETLYKISSKILETNELLGHRYLAGLYFVDEIGEKTNSKKDYKKVEYHALKIASNDIYASFYLGQIYSEGGHGIEKDDAKAFYWWNNGAKLGDTDCYDNLGWSYYYGHGVNQNFKKAYESFKKAISIAPNDAYAHYYMALMFKNGLYVKANRDSLKYYLQKAKDYGNEDALIMYENEF